ncbi:MAG: hypothetical protein K2P81_01220 [Bacteriovoracaceae bacterium]|nr:hypothetical protein [Bacteriovoracaceae bacterium]
MSQMLETGISEKLSLLKPSMVEFEVEESEDPLENLLNEFSEFDSLEELELVGVVTPPTVKAHQREDQMMHTLEGQLNGLREGLERLRFYLSDVDDSIRR